MDRRNMVQGEEKHTSSWQRTTTATITSNIDNTSTRDGTGRNNPSEATTTFDKTHTQETN